QIDGTEKQATGRTAHGRLEIAEQPVEFGLTPAVHTLELRHCVAIPIREELRKAERRGAHFGHFSPGFWFSFCARRDMGMHRANASRPQRGLALLVRISGAPCQAASG